MVPDCRYGDRPLSLGLVRQSVEREIVAAEVQTLLQPVSIESGIRLVNTNRRRPELDSAT